jgi:hypothetical protein
MATTRLALAIAAGLACGCGSAPAVVPVPDPVPIVAPAPAPSPSPNDVTLLSADPPQGSTISLATRLKATLSLSVNVASPTGLKVRAFLVEHPADSGTQCEVRVDGGPFYGPVTGQPATLILNLRSLGADCEAFPQPMSLTLLLFNDRETLALKQTAAFYTVTP